MLHWSSIAAVDSPLGLVDGVSPVPIEPVGVAQMNGLTCAPENTGPPMLWLVIFRNTPWPVPRSTDSRLGPSASPVIRPIRRPSGRAGNWAPAPAAPPGLPGRPPRAGERPRRRPGRKHDLAHRVPPADQ